jgi:predicted acetyltransferase
VKLTSDPLDLAEFYALYLYCFKAQDSPERRAFFNYRYAHSFCYGVKQEGHVKSGLLSIPLEVNFHGVHYKMNGICDVCTYPEFGGRGAISSLMKAALAEMFENGTALSYLSPFSYEFYRHYGYEQIFEHCHYQVESIHLPKVKADVDAGCVRRVDFKEAVPLIKELYDKDSKNHSGGLIRSDWWWEYLTKKRLEWKTAVYFNKAGIVQGYLVYTTGSTFIIQDFYSENVDSYQHLLKFVCQHQPMFPYFEYASSVSQAHLDFLKEPEFIKAQTKPYMMARIVNLREFIVNYPFRRDFEQISFSVEDKILAENNGVWELFVENGKAGLVKISENADETADIKFTVQSLSKSFLGYRSLAILFKMGNIVGNPQAIEKLSESLISETPMIQDYF